eukprot:TRINITY_DN22106_c0_g1_i1.p1 TRINITY_DN22106_c0_g1~~TRINITY_DN22106_c0_g1_i1.p1  ORF type:complete len:324 (+),score=48.19 TRINITY_DN22106_c0_g1_i1:82-1053(+)
MTQKRKTVVNINNNNNSNTNIGDKIKRQRIEVVGEGGVAEYCLGDEPYRQLEEFGKLVKKEPDQSREKVKLIRTQQKKFYDAYRVAIGEEEERKIAGNGVGHKGKPISMRPGDKAMAKFTESKTLLYHDSRLFGHIPGVKVNDKFNSRAEMKVLGLHTKHMGGIDAVQHAVAKNQKIVLNGQILQPVVAIVVADGYQDNTAQEKYRIEYTGEGGNDLLGDKKQKKDQKFSQGNKGLVDSCVLGTPIRVFWKQEKKDSLYGTVFLYDGLWSVRRWKYYKGQEGFMVFGFSLERWPGQPLSLAHCILVRSSTHLGWLTILILLRS